MTDTAATSPRTVADSIFKALTACLLAIAMGLSGWTLHNLAEVLKLQPLVLRNTADIQSLNQAQGLMLEKIDQKTADRFDGNDARELKRELVVRIERLEHDVGEIKRGAR